MSQRRGLVFACAAGLLALLFAVHCGNEASGPGFRGPITPEVPQPTAETTADRTPPSVSAAESEAFGGVAGLSAETTAQAASRTVSAFAEGGSAEGLQQGTAGSGRIALSLAPPAPSVANEGEPQTGSPGEENPTTPPDDKPEEEPQPRDPPCDQLGPSISARALSSNSIAVSWSLPDEPECDWDGYFEVNGPGLNLGQTTSTGDTARGRSAGTEYCYTVSVPGRGTDRSCARTLTACEAPSVNASGSGSTTMRVSWTPSSNCSTHTISGGNLSGSVTTSPLTDTGLTPDTPYCYTLTASSPVRESASDSNCGRTEDPPPPAQCSAPTASTSAISTMSIGIRVTTPSDCSTHTIKGEGLPAGGVVGTTATATGLECGREYNYTVTASEDDRPTETIDLSGRTRACDQRPQCRAPSRPSPSASLSGDTITVSWPAVPLPQHCTSVSYNVRRGGSSYDSTSGTEYSDTGLTAGRYCYQVSAVSSPGSNESPLSGSVCRTVPVPPTPTPSGPSAPGGFSATATSASVIELAWDAVSGADSYELRRKQGSGGSYASGGEFDVGLVTDYEDTRRSSNTEYCYQARTVDGTRKSSWTSERCATTHPDPPGNFAAAAGTPPETAISLSWDAVSAADRYEVRYREEDDDWGAWSSVGSGTGHDVSGLDAGTTYEFEIVTVVGTARSAEASASRRTAATLAPPANLRAERVSIRSLQLRWDAVANADGYRVHVPWGSPVDVTGTTYPTTLSENTLTPGETYRFQVTSVAGTDESARSGELTVTLPNPQEPETLTATVAGTDVTLSWSEGSGIGSWSGPGGSGMNDLEYRLWRRSPAGSGDWQRLAYVLRQREYEDAGLASGTEYEYRVQTLIGGPEFLLTSSGDTRTTATTELMMPSLSAEASSSVSVALSWETVTGGDGYEFEWRAGSGSWTGPVDAGTGTAHEHDGLNPETTYSHRLRAVMGSGRSGWSEVVETATPALEVPEGLSADAVFGEVGLSWDAVEAASGYELERRQGAAGTFEELASVTAAAYQDREVSAGTGYEYRLRSMLTRDSSRWESAWSETVTATAPASPPVPEGLAATVTSAFSVELEWEPSAGAENYALARRTGDGPWSEIATPEETGHEDSGLSPATTYDYRVRAVAGAAQSDWSDVVEAETWTFAAPENLAAETLDWRTVYVSWDAVPGEGVSYRMRSRLVGSSEWSVPIPLPRPRAWTRGLEPDTEYEREVVAVYESGGETWMTDPVTIRFRTPARPAGPEAPADLAGSATSSSAVSLSWTAVVWPADFDHEVRYEVSRRSGDGDWESVGDSLSTVTYNDDGVSANTAYSYRVRAVVQVDSGGPFPVLSLASHWSAAVSVTTNP